MEENVIAESGPDTSAAGFSEGVARYFKTFLETDLRSALLPARRVRQGRIKGLAAHLALEKYPQLHKNLYKNVASGFAQEAFVISQNKYVTHVDDQQQALVNGGIERLHEDHITALQEALARMIDLAAKKQAGHPDTFQHAFTRLTHIVIDADMVLPLLYGSNGDMAAESGSDTQLRNNAADKLYTTFRPALYKAAWQYFGNELTYEQLLAAMQTAITRDAVELILRELLQELQTVDAYQEIYHLQRNSQVLGGTDLYLYFCEITVGRMAFPLFYTSVHATHTYPSVTFAFENRVFVNLQALKYVIQEYSRLMQIDTAFELNLPSVMYIDSRRRPEFLQQLQDVVDDIAQAIGVEKSLQLDSTAAQTTANGGISLTNRTQLAVAKSTNEALIRDYEEILKPGSKAATSFDELLQEYVMGKPAPYAEAVAEEWQAKPLADKLLTPNPWRLNDEQKQALMSLHKEDTKTLVINGASGTGKSHFISGVVTESLMQGASVLVLSDVPAILDRVAEDITDLLEEVRGENNFHNPLLRLNAAGEDSLDTIEDLFLKKLQAYHQTYEKLYPELRTAKARKEREASEVLQTLIANAENINLHEVEQIVNNEVKFAGRDWIHDEPIEEINSDLLRLHQAIQYIRKSEANYLLPYIEASQQKAIAEFIGIIREYEKSNKAVNQRLPEFIVRYRKLLPEQKQRLQAALAYILSNSRQYIKILAADPITLRLGINDTTQFKAIADQRLLLTKLLELSKEAGKQLGQDKRQNNRILDEIITYTTAPDEIVSSLNTYIEQVISLRSKLFGFSGRTLVVENLTKQLKKSIPQFSLSEPEKNLDDLQLMVDVIEFIISQLAQLGLSLDYWKEVLYILRSDAGNIKELQGLIDALVAPSEFEFMAKYKPEDADNLLANISLLQYATEMNDVFQANSGLGTLFGVRSIGQVLKHPQAYSTRFNKLSTDLEEVKQLDESKQIIKDFMKKYPDASRRMGVNYVNGNLDIIKDNFAESNASDIKEYLAFKKKEQDLTAYFKDMISDTYSRSISELRQITATQISHSMDEKVLQFAEKYAGDLQDIKAALKAKQQLTPGQFNILQKAFPCMLGDIREYSLYLPLRKGQFDIVIIDEASRVSVAEALPSLLRAKKVIVLGDDKQYANEAAWKTSRQLNGMYRSQILHTITESLASLPADTKKGYIAKVREQFDVHNSVLNFCRAAANNELTLTKYFRSPPELISYTNKVFYDDKLKCLKARPMPMVESIKFEFVEPTAEAPAGIRTNMAEAQYIITALNNMKDAKYDGTIGIITPYPEQAVLIQGLLDESIINDWFERRRLKVLTFDMAQGETRDYVFYSMVSSPGFDQHPYIFPDSIAQPAVYDMPAQRLTVGFSRAGSVMHFVLSQPVDGFQGEIKAALAHYHAKVNGNQPKNISTTDILLAGESLLPQYFYSTKFYKKYTDRVRFINQFSLGDYVRPLAPRYKHPSYQLDFLVVLGDERIIISYDDFKENFMSNDGNGKQAATYVTAEDIYYQKVLEDYGYKFIHLNKFNLGSKPVERLDTLLSEAIKKSSWPRDNGFITK